MGKKEKNNIASTLNRVSTVPVLFVKKKKKISTKKLIQSSFILQHGSNDDSSYLNIHSI